MSKKNRQAPPRLEPQAGWDATDEERYNAGAAEVKETPAETPAAAAVVDSPLQLEGNPTVTLDLNVVGNGTKVQFAESVLGNLGESNGYQPRHVEVNGLTSLEQGIVARLRAGLEANHATYTRGNGRTKHVESAADAIRWLIQEVGRLSIAAAGS